jgi:hypothetical protein
MFECVRLIERDVDGLQSGISNQSLVSVALRRVTFETVRCQIKACLLLLIVR